MYEVVCNCLSCEIHDFVLASLALKKISVVVVGGISHFFLMGLFFDF